MQGVGVAAEGRHMIVSFIEHVSSPVVRETDIVFPDDFASFVVSEHKDVGLWSAARFLPGASRKDAHVETLSALVLDYDGKRGPVPDLSALHARWPYRLLVHSTWSHTPAAPRLRCVLPLAHPVTPAEYRMLYAWALDRDAGVDPSCRNPGRFFYWPTKPSVDAPFVYEYTPGEPLDPLLVVARLAPREGGGSSGSPFSGPPPVQRTDDTGGPFAHLVEARAPREDFDAIERACPFVAHAVADAAVLPEPEWCAVLSIAARCRDGEAHAQRISAPYPRYTPGETQAKFRRFSDKPYTCATISALWPGCRTCPHRGKITSPVQLGGSPAEAPRRGAPAAAPGPRVEDTDRALADAEARVSAAYAAEVQAILARERARAAAKYGDDDALAARVAAERDVRDSVAARRRAEGVCERLRARAVAGLPPGADPDVWSRLHLVATGGGLQPADTVANVLRVLTEDERWSSRLTFNAFNLEVCLDGTEYPEEQITEMTAQIGTDYTLFTSTGRMKECMRAAAKRREYHPVRDWLAGLTWDGVARAETLLSEGFGVEDEPLVRLLCRRFLLSMLARIAEPGCQVDTMLVLYGPQGYGKSRSLEALASTPWFSRTKLTVGDKDSFLQLRGHWLYEIAEMHDIRRAEANASKSWLSSSIDTYRAPYAETARRHPRQTVLVGTTNDERFLTDPSGNRRYWPVTCTRPLNPAWITQHREQIFAEAKTWHATGEAHWFEAGSAEALELARHARGYTTTDPWRLQIVTWLRARKGNTSFTAEDVLAQALLKPVGDATMAECSRVNRLLSDIGIKHDKKDVAGVEHTYYILDEFSREKIGVLAPDTATSSKVHPFPLR